MKQTRRKFIQSAAIGIGASVIAPVIGAEIIPIVTVSGCNDPSYNGEFPTTPGGFMMPNNMSNRLSAELAELSPMREIASMRN